MFLDYSSTTLRTVAYVPRLAQRALWRRFLSWPKISRVASKALNEQQRRRLLGEALAFLSLSSSRLQELARGLEAWYRGDIDHATISDLFGQLPGEMGGGFLPEEGFYLSQLCVAFGMFSVGERVHARSRRSVHAEARRFKTLRSHLRATQASIVDGDLELAAWHLNAAAELGERRHHESAERFLSNLASYLDFCLNLGSGQSSGPAFLLGPAPTAGPEHGIQQAGPLFRLAGPNVFDFREGDRNRRVSTQGIFVRPKALQEIVQNQGGFDVLAAYPMVLVPALTSTQGLDNTIQVDRLGGFFLSGHSQMAPLAIVELTVGRRHNLYVEGVTFFASARNYSEDSLRAYSSGLGIDTVGSYGGRFDRCGAFASHNLFENRSIVRNLFVAGAVTGDDSFQEALAPSNEAYAQVLDNLYGRTSL